MKRRTAGALVVATLVGAVAVLGATPTPAGAATGDITVFGATTPGLFPTGGLVEGPDGNLWFANQSDDLGEMTPSGTIALHDVAGVDASLTDVTLGGDGNLWFVVPTEGIGKIGRYNPTTDVVDVFDSPVIFPSKITTAADGTLWVLGSTASRILLNGTAGASYNVNGSAGDIMLGPDNNIWVTKAHGTESLLQINPTTGALIDEFPITGDLTTSPHGLTIGPDGDIWFSYTGGNNGGFGGIAHFDLGTETFTQRPFASETTPRGIEAGPDGNLWVVARSGAPVRRVTPAGVTTGFSQTGFTVGPSPHEITFGPDGFLWAGGTNRIGRIEVDVVDPACLPPAFSDVPTDHPFFDDICWMDQEGISTGFPNGTYKPEGNVTRSAMSAFMYRLADEPAFIPPGTATFNDVATSHPFFLEIEWMAAEDITTGFAGGLYKPNANVSRAAMSAFMHRLEPLLPA